MLYSAYREKTLRSGVKFYIAQKYEQLDQSRTVDMEESLHLIILLDGHLDLSFGKQRQQLIASTRPYTANVLLVNLNTPETFQRIATQGDFSHRLSINIQRSWLEESLLAHDDIHQSLTHALTQHLFSSKWVMSNVMRQLVQHIINPPDTAPTLQNLYLESKILELIFTVLCHHQTQSTQSQKLRSTTTQRISELKFWLQDNALNDLNIDQIAQQACVSVSTLQRQFRQIHGITVFEYLQHERIKQARDAIEHQGLSIEYAAQIAGFTQASNFATAFKRHYGISPKQLKLNKIRKQRDEK